MPSIIPLHTLSAGWGGPEGNLHDRNNPARVVYDNRDNKYVYWRLLGNAFVDLKLFKGLNIRSNFGLEYANKEQRNFTYPYENGYKSSDVSAVSLVQEHWTRWINNGDASYTGGGLSGLNMDVNNYDVISVMVFKRIAGTVRLELQDGTQSYFVTANYTTPGVWQKLTFTIPAGTGNITTLLVAPHFEDYTLNPIPDGEAHRIWWDEVVAYKQATSGINAASAFVAEIVSTQVYSLAGDLLQNLSKGEAINWDILHKGVYLVKKVDYNGKTTNEKIFGGKN